MARGTIRRGRVETRADSIPTTVTWSLGVRHNPQGVYKIELLPQRAALFLCPRWVHRDVIRSFRSHGTHTRMDAVYWAFIYPVFLIFLQLIKPSVAKITVSVATVSTGIKSLRKVIQTERNRKTRRKHTLSTTNATQTGLGRKSDLCGGKTTSNHLSRAIILLHGLFTCLAFSLLTSLYCVFAKYFLIYWRDNWRF